MIKIKLVINIGLPDLNDPSVPLSQIAEKVVTDAQRNIRMQKTPDDKNFEKLATSTVNKKRRLRYLYPQRALYATGLMFSNIKGYKISNQHYQVRVNSVGNPARDFLAYVHQIEGVNQHTKITRPFLGISKRVETYADSRMKRWIEQKIKERNKIIKKNID